MKHSTLRGKKILFISTSYFDYYKEIESTLTELGATVYTYKDEPNEDKGLGFLSLNLFSRFNKSIREKYEQRILSELKNKHIDYVFVIRGEFLREEFLVNLKSSFSNAKFLLYQWDSLNNYNYLPFIKHFDKVFSFDRKDCEVYPEIIYHHLFAIDKFYDVRTQRKDTSIDMLFVGSLHANRQIILDKIKEKYSIYNIKILLYISVFSFCILLLKKSIAQKSFAPIANWKKNYPDVIFKKISIDDITKLLTKTNIMIDISSPTQSGLTMRTFETLAAGCNLMTNNISITKEHFFDDKKIILFDIDNLPMHLPYHPVNSYVKTDFSLKSWLSKIFG